MRRICFSILSFIIFFSDIITDYIILVQYISSKLYLWAFLTSLFIFIPSIIIQFFSIRWFYTDGIFYGWKCNIIHVLQLGKVFRHFITIWLSFKSFWSSRLDHIVDYSLMKNDLMMLDIFLSFIQSAPQIVIQAYIITRTKNGLNINLLTNNIKLLITYVSILTSLMHIVWSVAIYSKNSNDDANRMQNNIVVPTYFSNDNTNLTFKNCNQETNVSKLSVVGVLLQWNWKCCMIFSRIVVIIIFASIYEMWAWLFMGIHWLVMTVWIISQHTQFCETKWEELLFNCVAGIVYCFTYFTVKGQGNRTRWKILIYHVLIGIENLLLLTLVFYVLRSSETIWQDNGHSIPEKSSIAVKSKMQDKFPKTFIYTLNLIYPTFAHPFIFRLEKNYLFSPNNTNQIFFLYLKHYIFGPAMIFSFASFIIGWISMLLYYSFFHNKIITIPTFIHDLNSGWRQSFQNLKKDINTSDTRNTHPFNGITIGESGTTIHRNWSMHGRNSFKSSFRKNSKLNTPKSNPLFDPCITTISDKSLTPVITPTCTMIDFDKIITSSNHYFGQKTKPIPPSEKRDTRTSDLSNLDSKRIRLQKEIADFLDIYKKSAFKKNPSSTRIPKDTSLFSKKANPFPRKLSHVTNINVTPPPPRMNNILSSDDYHSIGRNDINRCNFKRSPLTNRHEEVVVKGLVGKRVVSIDLKVPASLIRSLRGKREKAFGGKTLKHTHPLTNSLERVRPVVSSRVGTNTEIFPNFSDSLRATTSRIHDSQFEQDLPTINRVPNRIVRSKGRLGEKKTGVESSGESASFVTTLGDVPVEGNRDDINFCSMVSNSTNSEIGINSSTVSTEAPLLQPFEVAKTDAINTSCTRMKDSTFTLKCQRTGTLILTNDLTCFKSTTTTVPNRNGTRGSRMVRMGHISFPKVSGTLNNKILSFVSPYKVMGKLHLSSSVGGKRWPKPRHPSPGSPSIKSLSHYIMTKARSPSVAAISKLTLDTREYLKKLTGTPPSLASQFLRYDPTNGRPSSLAKSVVRTLNFGSPYKIIDHRSSLTPEQVVINTKL